MATKVGGNDLINDSGNLVNFTDLDSKYDAMYPDVQTVSSGQSSIDLSYAVVKVTVTSNNYPYTFANVALGNVCTIIVDTTANGYVPVFPERESGELYWPITGRPNWSSHRYWVITVIGVSRIPSSGVDVRATYFGHDDPGSVSNPIPAGTLYSVAEPNVGFYSYSSATDPTSASAYATSGISLRVLSNRFHAIGFEGSGNDYSRRYDAGGGYTTVDASATIDLYNGPVGVTPTGWRLVYGPTSNPTQFDTGWKTSGVANHEAYASVSVFDFGSGSDNRVAVVQLWGRASGYDDTVLATIRLQAEAYAEVTGCFTGDSRVAIMNNGNVELKTIGEAHPEWHAANAAGNSWVALGRDNTTNNILDFEKYVGRYPIYSFNGGDYFVTGGHPFLTTEGWKCADLNVGQHIRPNLEMSQLEVGDRLIKYNFITSKYYEEELTSIEFEIQRAAVYQLDVDGPDSDTVGNDTYIVNGYVVHNK